MTPNLRWLDDALVQKIVGEARLLLATLGVRVRDADTLALLGDAGARIDRSDQRARLTDGIIDRALASAPSSFRLFDAKGRPTHDFSGHRVHFTPGSAALNILDHRSGEIRAPRTADYIRYARVIAGLDHLASQSTAFIPADVHERVSDSYRLFLSLLYCTKPVITGAFTAEGFQVIRDLLVTARGDAGALRDRPLAVLTCCPTSPLQWDDAASRTLVACARHFIPVEIVTMPLAGFTAPVTLAGTLVQHTAEILSGIVIAQTASPGAPMLYGSSAAVFDMRFETTPMGAVETMMIACGCNEIGKSLRLPTQAYIGLSDAKRLDAQAGLESGMGAALAALSGINNVSGPGMLDFESCQSLEKLVVDNEICGMALRLHRGVAAADGLPPRALFEELLRDGHLIIADHTRRHLRSELTFPGPVIDRLPRPRWLQEGAVVLPERAAHEVERLEREAAPVDWPDEVRRALIERMEAESRRWGIDSLPVREA